MPKKEQKSTVSSAELVQLLIKAGFQTRSVVAPWQNTDVPKYLQNIETFEQQSRKNARNIIIT